MSRPQEPEPDTPEPPPTPPIDVPPDPIEEPKHPPPITAHALARRRIVLMN